MLFRQLFDQDTSTYTYLLADEATRQAVIIDPVFEQLDRDAMLIEELELNLLWALDTHVHADHVTAIGLLKERFGARSVVSEGAGAVCADRLVKQGDHLEFGGHALEVRETPGHTNGCVTYVSEPEAMAFTGDALLIRGCGRTDFQQGDSAVLYRSVHEQIFTLPEATLLYPGHDYKGRTVTSVAEEVRLNPRLGKGNTLEQFIHIMSELSLPQPRKIGEAVPRNLQCGRPAAAPGVPASLDTGWAPIQLSAAGVPEVEGGWLEGHRSGLLVVDVREPDEYRGELGHIPGALLVPLQTLGAAAPALPRDRPVVVVCRSGGRSGKAALELLGAGFAQVASLAGGMRAYGAERRGVAYGAPPEGALDRQG